VLLRRIQKKAPTIGQGACRRTCLR
jgi:hypothetical protein